MIFATGLFLAALARTYIKNDGAASDEGRMSAEQLQAAAKESTAAIAVFDTSGELQFTSPALTAILGSGRAWPPAGSPTSEADPAEAVREAVSGRARRLEFSLLAVDGSTRSIDGVFFPVDVGAGLIAMDVTDLRELQTYLPRVQRMETLGVVAGGLAHDFSNLLTVVLGNLHVVRLTVGQSPDAQHVLEETTQACERAADLIRQLLEYARPRALAVKDVTVSALLSETASLARGMLPATVEFKVAQPPPLASVEVDASAIQQVLLNLVMNARDAIPGGGSIIVDSQEARVGAPSPLAAEGLSIGSYHVISVADTGVGMDSETLTRVFDPFFTTKGDEKGTGLGLTTAQNIVQSFGGMITADSVPTVGTTFKVYLPAKGVLVARR